MSKNLRTVLITSQLKKRQQALEALTTRELDLKKREDTISKAIDETETDEDMDVIEKEIEDLEKEKDELEKEKAEIEKDIEAKKSELEKLKDNEPKKDDAAETAEKEVRSDNKKIGGNNMDFETRGKFFGGMTRSQMEKFVKREDVHNFVETTRDVITKRSVTKADLTIPEVVLEVLRDNLQEYSKTLKHVNVRKVNGTARQNIIGEVPEGIWTEATAGLKELEFGFSQIQVDGYKVAGFIVLPNSTAEDSELNLANEILNMLGKAIGYALDKAVLYGTGENMPVGIVTRLAETSKPKYWGIHERDWTDLSKTHLAVVEDDFDKPLESFKKLMTATNVIKNAYSNNELVWFMSRKTHQALNINAISINASGTMVSAVSNELPIIGGKIEELDWLPDGTIVGGYGSLYLLAERKGGTFATSTENQFIEDNTVFKGTARYDGRPIFGEGFVAINFSAEDGAVAPAPTDVVFAPKHKE